MTEQYVQDVIGIVTQACDKAKISEGAFWYWLGNTKFRTDNGELSLDRASYIQLHINELIKEFCVETEE